MSPREEMRSHPMPDKTSQRTAFQRTAPRTALVIGATGGVGGAIARRLLADGWRVTALNRDPDAAARGPGREGLEWIRGDAMVEADVVAAARGASLVVHGANPPAY